MLHDLHADLKSNRTEAQARAERKLHLRPVFCVGQVWSARKTPVFGANAWKIVAISDDATAPVIAQSGCGNVRAFGQDGHYDGERDEGDLDLVVLVTP